MADETVKIQQSKKPDPAVKLPKQLQDQVAAVEAMMTKPAEIQQADGSKVQETPPQPTNPTPVVPEVGTLPTPAAPPASVSPPEGTPEPDQAVRSLQGRLEAERRNNQALTDRLANLENMLATMRVQGQGEPQPTAPTYEKLITDQEEQDYGKEMLDVVGRKAKEVYSPELHALGQRIKQLEGRLESVGTVMQRTSEEKVYDRLTDELPDWEQINVSPEFKGWLSHVDPFSGLPRQAMLTDAFSRHDADRVVRFFKGFVTEVTGTPDTPQAVRQAAPPLANGQASEQSPTLMDYAAPGRARSAPQSELPPEKPVYSQAQIAKFYADMRTGKWRGREADAAAIERDIFQAQHEGRIQ